MDLGKQNILFFTRTMMLGGTENVVLQLCEVFKPKVNKIVVCSCGGVNVEKLTEMGIRHYQIPDISSKKDIFKICRTVKTNRRKGANNSNTFTSQNGCILHRNFIWQFNHKNC